MIHLAAARPTEQSVAGRTIAWTACGNRVDADRTGAEADCRACAYAASRAVPTEPCRSCRGRGLVPPHPRTPGAGAEDCPSCRGSGRVLSRAR